MSQEGLDKIKKELAEALAQRPVISAAIAEAREKGDLSENAEYESAREAQGLLELKIANLQNMVANAKILDSSQLSTDKVQMLNTAEVASMSVSNLPLSARAKPISQKASWHPPHLLRKLCSDTRQVRL